MTIEDKIDATAEQIEQSIEFGCLTKEHLRLILKQFTDEAVKKLNIDDVSKAKAELLDCKTCIWFKCETLEAPCNACFGRKKHVAIK